MFGMPVRIGKTNVRDEELRNNMADMLKNMSSASWGVFDEDDLIEFVSASSNSSAGLNYENLIDKADAQISKVILGQTMLSDSGASYSQSKVHERVAQTIIESDQKRIERLVNGQILPKLTSLGWDFEGLTFQYVKQDEHTQLEKAEIVGKLSQAGYTIDPEQIEEEFGYRILDVSETNAKDIDSKYNNK
jgi:phage gp29-like protein